MPPSNHPVAPISRRDFLVSLPAAALVAQSLGSVAVGAVETAAAPAGSPPKPKKYPVGLELYSVRGELARDLTATITRVARMGYEAVEFYSPYFEWTIPHAKEVKSVMDDVGLRCFSTHNHIESFTPGAGMAKAIELNQILGARHIILASAPKSTGTLDDWKKLCAQLSTAVAEFQPHGLTAGFHNHQVEWKPLGNGPRVMDVIAENTPAEFTLQFDVGTCMEAGADPIAWIKTHPGRIRSVHLKDWAPGAAAEEKGYRVLFGEGVSPWQEITTALEETGGVEFYLLEQEGSRYSEFETAERCLAAWKKFRDGTR